jgi:hypothetical protein
MFLIVTSLYDTFNTCAVQLVFASTHITSGCQVIELHLLHSFINVYLYSMYVCVCMYMYVYVHKYIYIKHSNLFGWLLPRWKWLCSRVQGPMDICFTVTILPGSPLEEQNFIIMTFQITFSSGLFDECQENGTLLQELRLFVNYCSYPICKH